MKKKTIFFGSMLVLGLAVAWWSRGGAEPVFKKSYPVQATSEHYEGTVVWPKTSNQQQQAGEASGVAVGPNGDIYYLHRANGTYGSKAMIKEATIVVLDGETRTVKRTIGQNLFQSPHGLEVDDANNIWVTDISLNQVFKLNPEGDVQAVYGQAYPFGTEAGLRIRNKLPNFPVRLNAYLFARPTDVTVLPDGSFAVADGYRNHRIAKFDRTGKFEWEVNQLGSADGQLNLPHGISSDDASNLYVADRNNARIQVFDRFGRHQQTWDQPELGRPYGVEVGPDGKVYVADGGDYLNKRTTDARSQIVVLDQQGTILERFGSFGTEPGQLRIAHDLAIADDGTIFVAELMNKRLQQFTPLSSSEISQSN